MQKNKKYGDIADDLLDDKPVQSKPNAIPKAIKIKNTKKQITQQSLLAKIGNHFGLYAVGYFAGAVCLVTGYGLSNMLSEIGKYETKIRQEEAYKTALIRKVHLIVDKYGNNNGIAEDAEFGVIYRNRGIAVAKDDVRSYLLNCPIRELESLANYAPEKTPTKAIVEIKPEVKL